MLTLEAVVQWRFLVAWIAISAAPAVIFVGLMMRPALLAFQTGHKAAPFREAPFPMLLAIGLAEFFCVSVGVAPNWLFGLLPANLAFQPYALERIAPQLELLGGAGVVFLLLRAVRVAPPDQDIRLLDVDAFYRGPAANAGRWLGVVALRVYGAGRDLSEHAGASLLRRLSALASQCDRPYRAGLAQVGQMAALLAVLAAALVFRLF
jgi:multicomponent Na+:H+ antiporter subunit D